MLYLQRIQKKFWQTKLHAISIPDYVIKKSATHGARHGKTEVQREYHLVCNAWACETSIWLQSLCRDEKSLTQRIRRTTWSVHPSRTTKTHTTRTRIFLQKILVQRSIWPTYRMAILVFISKFLVGGTHPNGVGSQLTFFLARISFLLQLGFVYSWWRSIVTDGVCEQNVLTQRIFSYICKHFILVHNHGMAQDVATRVS